MKTFGVFFILFVCATAGQAQEFTEPPVVWKYPCEEYARVAIKYFTACEESGGISRATNAAFGHFALDLYRECRKASGTTYFFPENK